MNWEPKWPSNNYSIKIGNIVLYCNKYYPRNLRSSWWVGSAFIYDIPSSYRIGIKRFSKDKAKEDAIRLAEELLEDYHTSIVAEMEHLKKFKSKK